MSRQSLMPVGPESWMNLKSVGVHSPTYAGVKSHEAFCEASKENPRLVRVAAAHFKLAKDEAGAVEACAHALTQARAACCTVVVLPGHAKNLGAQAADGPFLSGVAAACKRLGLAAVVAVTMTDGVRTVLIDKAGATVESTSAKDHAAVSDLHKFGGSVALRTGKHALKDVKGAHIIYQSINETHEETRITADTGAVAATADAKAAFDLIIEDVEPAKKSARPAFFSFCVLVSLDRRAAQAPQQEGPRRRRRGRGQVSSPRARFGARREFPR